MNAIKNRKLVSFSGVCPINCKHCYTYELAQKKATSDADEIKSITANLNDGEPYDVIYVSHDRENFVDEDAGINLVEVLCNEYRKHIFIITRMNLSDACINRLAQINRRMQKAELLLSVAVSIPATTSYTITENSSFIASPEERCDCIRRLHNAGIKTILMARPVFPNSIIPVKEITEMIQNNAPYIDAVVSSGLAVNPTILQRLNMSKESFTYLPGNNAEYLIGSDVKDIKYINVNPELERIKDCCTDNSIPFSTHSMQALNMLLE